MNSYSAAVRAESTSLLNDCQSLEQFLAGVERRALQMARVRTGDPDAALDIVQDAMYKLVKNYRDKGADDWPPLFYRILNNGIADFHRKRARGWKVFDRWFGGDDTVDPVNTAPAAANLQPDSVLQTDQSMAALETAIRELSTRQQQAFMLRCWEGLNTADTANAMGCSEGTVKTLYSRALHSLRDRLEATHGE